MKEILTSSLIAALDIGTDKVCSAIAKIDADGRVEIIGFGHRKSKGVKNGMITNIDDVAEAVRTAISDAEITAKEMITGVVVNTPVAELFSSNIVARVPMVEGEEIAAADVSRLIDSTIGKSEVKGGGLIHAIPYNFFTDSTKDIENPIGMPASELGVRMNLISSHANSLKLIDKVLIESRILHNRKVACPYASALGALSPDENGIVIDIGAGKTGVAVFADNRVVYSAIIPFGSGHITARIANDLTIGLEEAERIKTIYGCAFASPLDKDSEIEINPIGEDDAPMPYKLNIYELNCMINPIVANLFGEIKSFLEGKEFYNIPSKRIVLTGGGSLMQGIRDVAGGIFENRLVRLGAPLKLKGDFKNMDSAVYTTVSGLLQYAAKEKYRPPAFSQKEEPGVKNFFRRLLRKN